MIHKRELESIIIEAIENAIDDFEMKYGNIYDVEIESNVTIDSDGTQDFYVEVYEK